MPASPIDVFDYVDYRAFLRDYYAAMKERKRGFSFRAFSRRAKLRSPNHLKRVMEGDRNLTDSMAARFAEACGLEHEAGEYFQHLVSFNQASTTKERAAAYKKLTGFQRYRQAHVLDLAHAAYHATWYLPAIRELAGREGFQADPEWIAPRLMPPIKVSEARRALDTLVQLGLLVQEEDGQWGQADEVVSTGPEMHTLHIASYHQMMMGRASESIDLIPSKQRDISALTLLMGDRGVDRLKRRIQRFRRELVELSLLEDDPRQVVQVNFQLFPLTVPPDEEPRS